LTEKSFSTKPAMVGLELGVDELGLMVGALEGLLEGIEVGALEVEVGAER
jgi:hypothetical protein